MSKLQDALVALEKSRVLALEAAIADRQYRLCAALDGDGPIQRGVDRARKLLERRAAKVEPKKPAGKK